MIFSELIGKEDISCLAQFVGFAMCFIASFVTIFEIFCSDSLYTISLNIMLMSEIFAKVKLIYSEF